MRIAVLAIGTRGDVEPLIALSATLKHAGHNVVVAAQSLFSQTIRSLGLKHHSLSGDARGFFAGSVGKALRAKLMDPVEFTRFWRAYISPMARRHLSELPGACHQADVIVCQPWFQAAPSLEERFRVPCLVACVMPVPAIPSSTFENPFCLPTAADLTAPDIPRSWASGKWFAEVAFDDVNHWRESVLGLRTMLPGDYLERVRSTPHLFGYSPSVLPRPTEWVDIHRVVGYWFLNRGHYYVAPVALQRFLSSGSVPLVLGFSSQPPTRRGDVFSTLVAALKDVGKRGIIVTGWAGMPVVDSENCLIVNDVSYEWLLPQVSGMIHHGGAGTVGECIRSEIPSAAIPQGYDGYFWGRHISTIGIGPAPMLPKDLSFQAACELITSLAENRTYRSVLRDLGASVRAEDGCSAGVAAIESYVGSYY